MTLPLLRAGDSDRAAVIDLLRAHHLDGRLTVEEFEERVEQAHGAVTLLELGGLHEDLPDLTPRRGKVVRRSTRAPRVPGLLPFVERVNLDADPVLARELAFELIAPALAKYGYTLRVDGRSLVFQRRRRPPWTLVVAVATFPFGLLALLHQETDEVIVDIEPGVAGGTMVMAHGVGPLTVRRAFAQLGD